jgi:hypothetical protein
MVYSGVGVVVFGCVRVRMLPLMVPRMLNAGAGLLLLKSERSLLGSPRAYPLASFMLICWIAFAAKASIIVFYCFLDNWTVCCLH